jgi:hypothetical protein
VELYHHSPICLHGVVLGSAQGQLYIYLYHWLIVKILKKQVDELVSNFK